MNNRDKTSGKIVIVADDFTGANDTGVQFCKQGLKSVVIINNENIVTVFNECDVLVVDTESRFSETRDAYIKACETGNILKELPIRCLYKKLDSTFRGNPGAEIAGLMDSMNISHTLLAPAFPSNKRITKNGLVYIDGEQLRKTEFARDPKNPVRKSYIPDLISSQTDKSIRLINYKEIRAGRRQLELELQQHLKNGIEIIVADALDENDLDLLASVAAETDERLLYAGSTGFAGSVSKYLVSGTGQRINVVVAGSLSEVTRKQISFAVDNLPLSLIDIDVDQIVKGNQEKEKKRITGLVRESYSKGLDVIIRSAADVKPVSGITHDGEKSGIKSLKKSDKIAGFLGATAAEIIASVPLNGIVLTGGDTAIRTVNALNVSGTLIREEVLPGIPWGYFIEKDYSGIRVVTKAGGFGEEDAIYRILNFLKNDRKTI